MSHSLCFLATGQQATMYPKEMSSWDVIKTITLVTLELLLDSCMVVQHGKRCLFVSIQSLSG